MEEFGIEEFGSEPEAVASDATIDPKQLKDIIDDINTQLAATMDPAERGALQKAKEAAQKELDTFKLGNKSESQWVELSKAYFETFGTDDEFKKRLVAKNGISDTAYEEMRHELAQHHAAAQPQKEPTKRGRKKAALTVQVAEVVPSPTPQSRWEHVLEHATLQGMSAQVIFDELGFTELTHETVGQTLAEINKRALPPYSTRVEEFGSGESLPEVAAPATVPTTAPSTSTAPIGQSESGGSAYDWDAALNRLVDPDTGLVIERGYFLEVLGWPEMPTELSQEQITHIVDTMHTRFLDPAARYRAQAEKIAEPLEKKAAIWEQAFGHLFDQYGKDHLPTVKKVGSKNFGQYSKKTIDLLSGSISWRANEGGTCCIDEPAFHVWLAEQHVKIQELRELGEEGAEEIAMLEKLYGVRLKTVVDYNRDKIKEAVTLPPGWDVVEKNEFAKRTIK